MRARYRWIDGRAVLVPFTPGEGGYLKCPACGYWAFNGVECFDCGYLVKPTEEGENS